MNTRFILLIFLVGILHRLLEREQRHFVLRLAHHGRVELLVGKEIVEVDIAYHRGFEEIHLLVRIVGVVAHEHVSRRTHQNGVDIDGAKQRSQQNAAVYTVHLRRLQGIVERAHPLGVDHIARQAGVRHRAVPEAAFLQYVPERVNLLVHRPGGFALVAEKTGDDARIERLAKQCVDLRVFLVHVRGKEKARVVKVGSVGNVPQQALVDAAHGKRPHLLPHLLAVHLHGHRHAHGFRLHIVPQGFVVPDDVGIHGIFRSRPVEHELRNRAREERSARHFDTHPRIGLPGFQPDGNARLRIAHVHRIGRHDDLCVGSGYREDSRGENVPSQIVHNLKSRTGRGVPEQRHAPDENQQSDESPRYFPFISFEIDRYGHFGKVCFYKICF